jgi:hypothetical protein
MYFLIRLIDMDKAGVTEYYYVGALHDRDRSPHMKQLRRRVARRRKKNTTSSFDQAMHVPQHTGILICSVGRALEQDMPQS